MGPLEMAHIGPTGALGGGGGGPMSRVVFKKCQCRLSLGKNPCH